MKGRVIQTTGSWYKVLVNDTTIDCRLKGKFKQDDLNLTNPIAVGDWVTLEKKEAEYVIDEIHSRSNYIIRQSPRNKRQRHIIASNIDQAILLVSIASPRTSSGFIDRFLAAAESFHIPTIIVINKMDLIRNKDEEKLQEFIQIYTAIGYTIELITATNITDLEKVKAIIEHKTTLVSGHSGVGKSTLINGLNKELNLKTGTISTKWQKGKHTTTFTTMFEVFKNSFIVDTPGIKEFMLLHVEPEELSGYFLEINNFAKLCTYNNCKHFNEPNCAVKKAVQENKISASRFENYLSILHDIQEINHWERK